MYCFEFKKLTVETYNKIFLWENHSEMHILERWRQKWTKIYWLVLMFNHFLWSLIRLSHIRNLIIKSHQILSGSKIPIVPSKTPMKNVNRRKTCTSRNNESDCSSVSPKFSLNMMAVLFPKQSRKQLNWNSLFKTVQSPRQVFWT